MKNKLSKYVPAGLNPEKEIYFFLWGLFFSFLFSVGCPNRCYQLRTFLIKDFATEPSGTGAAIYLGAFHTKAYTFSESLMPDFVAILGNALLGFFILALCMLLLAVYHYSYHFWGSKSIYLMRRLPQHYGLFKRCLALPVAAACLSLLCAFLLLLLYYADYILFTPTQYLPSDQWQKIWSAIL